MNDILKYMRFIQSCFCFLLFFPLWNIAGESWDLIGKARKDWRSDDPIIVAAVIMATWNHEASLRPRPFRSSLCTLKNSTRWLTLSSPRSLCGSCLPLFLVMHHVCLSLCLPASSVLCERALVSLSLPLRTDSRESFARTLARAEKPGASPAR